MTQDPRGIESSKLTENCARKARVSLCVQFNNQSFVGLHQVIVSTYVRLGFEDWKVAQADSFTLSLDKVFCIAIPSPQASLAALACCDSKAQMLLAIETTLRYL